ncbi:MAG: hypothetical protein ACI87O_000596 [Planctomycetota bacterium]|jgi:hypothetical protein
MGKFLKENWIYILLPVLLVLGAILYLVFSGDGSGAGEITGYEI